MYTTYYEFNPNIWYRTVYLSNVSITDGHVLITHDVPGSNKDNSQIEWDDESLSFLFTSKFGDKKVKETFRVGKRISTQSIKAEIKDGVLTITCDVESKTYHVEIK